MKYILNNLQILVGVMLITNPMSCHQQGDQREIKIPSKWVAAHLYDKDSAIAILPTLEGQKMDLTREEMKVVDSLTKKAVDVYNLGRAEYLKKRKREEPSSKAKLSDYTIDLKKYKRQYIVSFNKKGQKEIYVNCLCSVLENQDWKTEEIVARDGGKCYFQLKVNLSEKTYFEFGVNGLG